MARATGATLALGAVAVVSALSACSGTTGRATVAVLTTVHGPGPGVLAADAATLTTRLRIIGESADTASVRGATVVVTGPRLTVPAADLLGTGTFSLRPVLCGAPAYSLPAAGRAAEPIPPVPVCQPEYASSAANLGTTPDFQAANGFTANSVPPDPALATYPSAPADDPGATQLLAADPAAGAQQYPRFVVGPTAVQNDALASVSAQFDRIINAWAVLFTFTPTGSLAWDRLARARFHAYVAVDIDGRVESAPIIQPTVTAFTSFGGRGEISGNFTATTAKILAAELASGPLAATLHLSGAP